MPGTQETISIMVVSEEKRKPQDANIILYIFFYPPLKFIKDIFIIKGYCAVIEN